MEYPKAGNRIFFVEPMSDENIESFNNAMAKFNGAKKDLNGDKPGWLISCTLEEAQHMRNEHGLNVGRMSTKGFVTDTEETLEMAVMAISLFFLAFDIDNFPAVRNLVLEGYDEYKKLLQYPPSKKQYEKMGFNMFQQNALINIIENCIACDNLKNNVHF